MTDPQTNPERCPLCRCCWRACKCQPDDKDTALPRPAGRLALVRSPDGDQEPAAA